jgi:signal transduction histidine kinase
MSVGTLRTGRSIRRLSPRGEDAVLAGALALVSLLQVLVFLPIASPPVGAFVALGSTVPVAWRRTRPVAAAVGGSLVWLVPADGYVILGYVAAVLLYYSVGAHVADRRLVVATTAFGAVLGVAASVVDGAGIGELAGAVLAVVAPAAVGVLVRAQRDRASELEEIAGYLERDRDHRARIAVDEERARIARELHDIVSHAVSLIAVQADAAEAALDHDPGLARRPLATVRSSAHEALDEMRRLLGVLRADGAGPEREPLPGLAEVGALVADARAAGVEAELSVEGQPRPLAQSLELSAYRIVQEALANARRHARGAPVSVRVAWLPDALRLEVRDRGQGPSGPPAADAHGLLGMRERVRLHRGELRAGAAPGGGFEVVATLPLEAP